MKANMDDGSANRLDDVLALVRTRMKGAQRGPLERFVARYFGQVDPEDLEERAPADLYGAALSHWNFARRREPGQARRCACSTRRSTSTAGSRRTRSSRSSTTTCRSSSTR